MMQIGHPFHFDSSGRSATTTEEQHIRDMIEQVLFTTPGERVNNPTFGSGVLQLLFAPNSDALAAATQVAIQGALQQWLSEVIRVEGVNVQIENSTLQVTVQYTIWRTQQRQVAQFIRGGTL